MREVKLTAQEIKVIKRALISHLATISNYLKSDLANPDIVSNDIRDIKRILDEIL